MRELELLAPAKNCDYGIEAINCGADAIYIGATMFGARAAAANSVEDIARLVAYGHKFGVKIFVALNTILYDDEIEQAEQLAWKLYDIGVDGLIVQDMAFATMNLPPLPLHASTQTTNLTAQKVKNLQDMGFERVVLERALSLEQIGEICEVTECEIEAFVHGAICVSYSGNCFFSQLVAQRSANRGVCAQPCRSTFDLVSDKGEIILKDKHLLSVKDFSLEKELLQLAQCGVKSFKIEGRLKDISYLRNITAHYNNLLNKIVAKYPKEFKRSSRGVVTTPFEPNPAKTFSRALTPYLINGNRDGLASFYSAKSTGEYLGEVVWCKGNGFSIDKKGVEFTNGDGLCFVTPKGDFLGFNVNGVEGDRILAPREIALERGTKVFRNLDKRFVSLLERANSTRKLTATINLKISVNGVEIEAKCGDVSAKIERVEQFEKAQNVQRAKRGIVEQFSKSGATIFDVKEVEIEGEIPFITSKVANAMRRELLELLEQQILLSYIRHDAPKLQKVDMKGVNVDYKYNVANKKAAAFYQSCGAMVTEQCVEQSSNFKGVELMRTGYCIRKEIGECLKEGGKYEQLYLKNGNRTFRLQFFCKSCEMAIFLNE